LFGLPPAHLLGYVTETQDRLRGMCHLFDIQSSRLPKPQALLARASEQLGDLLLRTRIERNATSDQCSGLRQENALLRERIREFEQCCCQDSLTEVYTRDYFNARLDQRLERCGEATQSMAILFADVDGLKEVNDEYGHLVGDEVICQVAAAIRQCLRSTDIVARYGGDEFVILLDNASVDDLKALAENIRQRVAKATVECNGKEIAVTVSVGGVLTNEFPEKPGPIFADQLLDHADKAMYRAKKNGGNEVSLESFGKGLRRQQLDRIDHPEHCLTMS
jgi:diguanylate cyclase (GGDEF)-like protein